VYPALAVVDALGERVEVLWVGGEGGMETELVPRAGIPFRTIPAAGVHGVSPSRLPGNVASLLRGIWQARGILREYRPDVIFFTGGYVGVPVALADWATPKALFVPDIEPGLAARVISRRCQRVFLTTEESRQFYWQKEKVLVTGYPTRPQLRETDKRRALQALDLESGRLVLLAMGGSRGAQSINRALWAGLRELLLHLQVIHITGMSNWAEARAVREELPRNLQAAYHPFPYLHERMGAALAAADLALSRAGASALGEYPLFALPAVLVPYPYAWRYQHTNAQHLARRGAAVVIPDGELERRLLPTIIGLIQDPLRLQGMSRAANEMAKPEAAAIIGEALLSLPDRRRRPRG
jgi:undecaprenyldiphospho-muramoylpentapeptide beta-N-acetylglucosaminyltransferase